ncbi:MAG: hypothetical protein LBD23_01780 [Oscillospiraceae bacterium]|jgi:hypothetical protein|nr:hypothetical protein [Oscillospiraceae bacterium]
MKRIISLFLALVIVFTIYNSIKLLTVTEETTQSVEISVTEIPTNLDEVYKVFDEQLKTENIEYIKNTINDEFFILHFELGMWIHNNWLRPENSILTEALSGLNSVSWCIDDMSSFIIKGYHHYLNDNEYTIGMFIEERKEAENKEFIWRLSLMLTFILTVAIIRFSFKKLPQPLGFLERFGRPKFLRITFVFCILALINTVTKLVLGDVIYWTTFSVYIYWIILALLLSFSALFCFVDMTKKQIAISAILPTTYFIIYGIESNLFEYGIGYGILSFLGRFIFPTDYVIVFKNIIEYLPNIFNVTLSVILMLFPLIYVLLARSKNTSTS